MQVECVYIANTSKSNRNYLSTESGRKWLCSEEGIGISSQEFPGCSINYVSQNSLARTG